MTMQKLTIDRRIWLRGEGGHSYLHRHEDGKECCVGIYLREVGGASVYELNGVTTACALYNDSDCEVPTFLLRGSDLLAMRLTESQTHVNQIYAINDDDTELTEAEREAQVAGWFALYGDVDVAFIGPVVGQGVDDGTA